MIHSFQKLLL